MRARKAGRFKLIYIISMSGIYTLWSCGKAIYGSYLVKDYRSYIDRVLNKWAVRIMALINVSIRVKGGNNLPIDSKRPVIVMCNHSSLYDVPVAILAIDSSFRFIAKKELFSIPIFGSAIKKGEIISIDRQSRTQAMKDLQRAKEKMLDGVTIWIAPEGTTTKDGKLAKFKKGGFHVAIDTSALIVPIVIKDIHKVQADYDLDIYTNQEIEVEICKPVDAENYKLSQRAELMNKVRTKMLTALGQEESL